jgi:hypothetical protein
MTIGAARHNRQSNRSRPLLLASLAVCWFLILLSRLSAVPNVENNGSWIQQSNEPAGVSPPSRIGIPRGSSDCPVFLSTVTQHSFFPKRFFEQGAGRPFLPILQHVLDNSTGILNTRFLLVNLTNTGCQTVYYHIHKNGGTTLERHIPLPMDNYYSKREKGMGRVAFEQACQGVMQRVAEAQQHDSLQRPRVFTFFRDPVPRFLSSVAQVLKLRVWHKRLYPCYERNTTTQLLDCVLDKIESTGSFLEMHFNPQSFELYKYTMGFDIEVDVMDISRLDTVLQQMGAGQVAKERSTTGTLIRRFPKFRLTREALTPELISRICKIYNADVVMLQETGVTRTECKL